MQSLIQLVAECFWGPPTTVAAAPLLPPAVAQVAIEVVNPTTTMPDGEKRGWLAQHLEPLTGKTPRAFRRGTMSLIHFL